MAATLAHSNNLTLRRYQMVDESVITTQKPTTRKEKRNAPARSGPLDTPVLREEILRLLRSGVTMTEMCARDDMPPLATLFNMRRVDPAFGAEFALAMTEQAEALISDAMEQAQGVIDAELQPVNPEDAFEPGRAGSSKVNAAKSAEFYMNSALKYAGAIAPAKYGQLLKVTDAQIGNGVQISITSYAPNPGSEGVASLANPDSTAPV